MKYDIIIIYMQTWSLFTQYYTPLTEYFTGVLHKDVYELNQYTVICLRGYQFTTRVL